MTLMEKIAAKNKKPKNRRNKKFTPRDKLAVPNMNIKGRGQSGPTGINAKPAAAASTFLPDYNQGDVRSGAPKAPKAQVAKAPKFSPKKVGLIAAGLAGSAYLTHKVRQKMLASEPSKG